jgi:hypothetical protein
VSAYANGVLIGTQVFSITDQNSTLLTFDQSIFGQVNQVTFNNNLGYSNALAFDDLKVNEVSPVPEPATCGLLLTGLAFVGAKVRRRRRSNKSVALRPV